MNKEELIKYIKGELNAEQRIAVEAWINENPGHQKEFADMKKIWEWSAATEEGPEIDVDRAWSDFVKLRDQRPKEMLNWENLRSRKVWVRWGSAAAVVFLLLSSWVVLQWTLSSDLSLSSDNKIQQAGLPDGSKVYLNKRTALDYQKNWLDRERKVRLTRGEVFFEVKRDTTRPFVIQSGNSTITVLGTSFHVRRENGETEVIVSTGSVRVDHGKNSVRLYPNERLIIQDTSHVKARVEKIEDQLYKYYIHQEFIFENTPLARVFDVLGKAFDTKFTVVDERNRTLRYTATFERQTLNEMLDVILKTFELKIEKEGNVYYIKG